MKSFRPLHDRILVKRSSGESQTASGLVIPDAHQEKPAEALVVAVGNGKLLENGTRVTSELKAGQKVIFGKYSGTEVKLGGEDHLILREDDILAVFN